MPLYKYKFKKGDSEEEETKEFADKGALYSAVRLGGGNVISVEEVKEKSFLSLSSLPFFSGKVKTQDIITFSKNLAVMLDAGLSLSRALAVLRKQTHSKKLSAVLEDLETSISGGETFSAALSKHPKEFSNLFISMVKAGEEGGQIVETLKEASSQLEKSHLLVKKVQGAMMYPAIVLSIMIILGVVMLVYMVPTLTETFKGLNIELPLPTRIIIAMSDFLRFNYLLILVLLGGIIFAITSFFRTVKGKRFKDFMVLHIPLVSNLLKEVYSARTARTLSSLIAAGVDIVVAIGVTRDVMQNVFYKEVLTEAETAIQNGDQISSVFINASHLYPVFVGEMASVGEETGKLGSMFQNIANFYEGEVDQKTKDMSTIIEPFLMVFMGIGVGLFAVAMLAPTYSLVDSIQ